MGYEVADAEYSPQSLATSSNHNSEVEDFSRFEGCTNNYSLSCLSEPSQDSPGAFHADNFTVFQKQSHFEAHKINTRGTRGNRGTLARTSTSTTPESPNYSPTSSPRPSRRQPFQPPGAQSPMKPYRGGRRKEEPPPCMSAEERRKWEKERVKKDNHNKIEKRRRYKINDCISIIGRMLPPYEFDQLNKKGAILQTAIEYIKMLQDSQAIKEKLLQENKRLKEANDQLQMQLEAMKKENSPTFMTPDQLQQLISKSSQFNYNINNINNNHNSHNYNHNNIVKKEEPMVEMHDFHQAYTSPYLNNNNNTNNFYNNDTEMKSIRRYDTYPDHNDHNDFMVHTDSKPPPPPLQPQDPLALPEAIDDFSTLSSAFSSSNGENLCCIDELDLSFFAIFSDPSLCSPES